RTPQRTENEMSNNCAVTQNLNRHLAAADADNERDEAVHLKVSEMELDEACVAEALDSVFSNLEWIRIPVTGKAGNLKLSAALAQCLINRTATSDRDAVNKIAALLKDELY